MDFAVSSGKLEKALDVLKNAYRSEKQKQRQIDDSMQINLIVIGLLKILNIKFNCLNFFKY